MSKNIACLLNETDRNDCFNAAKELLENPAGILDNIMESLGDGLSIQDRNMRIVYQNQFMIDNFGAHVGAYCYNIYEKRDAVCEGCPIMASYRTGHISKALRVGITKDGLPFRFENIASVLRNKEGEIVAGIELCRIVEDREKALDDLRDAMEKLKQTQNQLVRAEKLASIGHLAAGVAHEINNPAAFILSNLGTMRQYVADLVGYIDAMEKLVTATAQGDSEPHGILEGLQHIIRSDDYRYLKSDLPEVIEDSLNGLNRIKDIVSRLREFAQSSASEHSMVDVNVEIETALVLLDPELRKKGRVVKNLGSLPMTFANPRQLRQLFLNLILNASQAIKPDGTIAIKTEAEGHDINIAISDDGVGIPADVIKNIFNPFFTTRDVGKGLGMGLSIVYRIIESHEGNIDVQSEPGHGTTFTIRLPISGEHGT